MTNMQLGSANRYTHLLPRRSGAGFGHCFTLFTKLLLVSFLIFSFPGNAITQSENYDEEWRWVHFTMESGLPSNEIVDIVETSDGTPWAVTTKGLAWFDGYGWNGINEEQGLPEKGTKEVFTDSRGKIYLLIERNVYFGDQKGFQKITIDDVSDFALLKNNQILICKNSSLFIFDQIFNDLSPFSDSRTDGVTNGIFYTNNRSIYVNVYNGLYKWVNKDLKLIIKSFDYALGLNSKIYENAKGNTIASIIDPVGHRGFWEWNSLEVTSVDKKINGEFIECMDIEENGNILAVYSSGEVKARENRRWKSLFFLQSKLRDITSCKFSKNGNLWIGTERGLFLYRKSISRWEFSKREYPDQKNRINEILKTKKNQIWLATDGGLEIIYSNGGHQVIETIEGQKLTAITGIAEDENGNIWISSGSFFSGAYRWDGAVWKYFRVVNSDDTVQFHKIRKDRQGRLWFLGLSKSDQMTNSKGGGAYVLENNNFTRWSSSEGLLHSRVYAFAQGTDSALWFGTFAGVSRWKNGSWKHWSGEKELKWGKIFTGVVDHQNNFWFANRSNGLCYIDQKDQPHYLTSSDGIAHDHVWDVRTDSAGQLWVSTKGGVSYFNNENQTWTNFSLKTGLSTLDIWPVLPDGNKVYIGTNGEGLAVLNMENLHQYPPKILLDGKIVDAEGIYLKWRALAYWGELLPQDVLTRVKIDNQPWGSWLLSKEASYNDLSPGEHTFQIQAKGLFGQYDQEGYVGSFVIPTPWYYHPLFLAPTSVMIIAVVALGATLLKRKRDHALALRRSEAKFRSVSETTSSAIFIIREGRFLYCNSSMIDLSGFEKERFGAFFIEDIIQTEEWNTLRNIVKRLEQLPDGKFQLELHVTPREGRVKSLLSTFGTIDYGMRPAILGTAVDITDRRIMEVELSDSRMHYKEMYNRANILQGELGRLSQEVMRVQEDERKRLSRELHDEIGQLLTAVTINLEILKRTASAITYERTLNDTARLVHQVFQSVHNFSRELRPTVLDELGFLSAIRWYTKDFQERTGIRLQLNIEGMTEEISDDQKAMLYRVVQESLTNVVKHSHATTVNLEMTILDKLLILKISDNGKGISREILSSDGENGTGLGILGMRERVHIAKGKFIIDSAEGSGTTIQVQIQLNGKLTSPIVMQ